MTLRGGKRGKKFPAVLTLLVIVSISLAVLLPAVSADTDGIVTTNASVNPGEIRIGDTTRVTLTINSVNVTEKVPVDVMHVIDRSGSMGWYGDVIHNNSGLLTFEWTEIDNFIINSSITTFDVLLETNSDDTKQYLQIKSPSGVWYGYNCYNPDGISYRHYAGRDHICLYSGRVESGTWEVYARGDVVGRPYVLAVQVPPIRLDAAKDAAKTFVGLTSDQDQMGAVSFSTYATLNKQLTLLDIQENRTSVNSTIDDLSVSSSTGVGEGINKAKAELTSTRSRDDALKVMVLLSDGVSNSGSDPRTRAQEAADENIKIFTVGFGEADHELLNDIADITGGNYYYAPSGSDLQEVYKTISEDIAAMASRTHAYYVLPDDVEYMGNATREPSKIIGNTLRWDIGDLAPGTPWDVSFDVRPTTMGTDIPVIMAPYSRVTYETTEGEEGHVTTGGNIYSYEDLTFGFVVHEGANPGDNFEFHDHAIGMNVHSNSTSIHTVTVSGSTATFSGNATVNGVSGYEFIVHVEDNAESGDIFMITITGPDGFKYTAGGVLDGGSIQTHKGSSESVPFPAALSVDVNGCRSEGLDVFVPPEWKVIGETVGITGYAVVDNPGSKAANVSVKLCVDYPAMGYTMGPAIDEAPTIGHTMHKSISTVNAGETKNITVSTTWIPMSSGKHSISIYVYEHRDDGTELWTESQGPNSKTVNKTIYIRRVS